MKLYDKELGEIRFSSKEFQEQVEAGRRDVRKVGGRFLRIDVNGIALLEKSLTVADQGYSAALVNGTYPIGDAQAEISMVYCNGFKRVKNKIIHVIWTTPLKDEDSVPGVRKDLAAWFKQIEKAN